MKRKATSEGCNPRELYNAFNRYLASLDFTKLLTKRLRVIAWPIVTNRTGYRITRFVTEHVGDVFLPITVQSIGLHDRAIVSRSSALFLARHKYAHCSEYWLEPDQIKWPELYLMQLMKLGTEQ